MLTRSEKIIMWVCLFFSLVPFFFSFYFLYSFLFLDFVILSKPFHGALIVFLFCVGLGFQFVHDHYLHIQTFGKDRKDNKKE